MYDVCAFTCVVPTPNIRKCELNRAAKPTYLPRPASFITPNEMQKGTSQGLSLSIISTTIMLPTIIEQLFPSLLPTMLDRDVSKAVISLTRYVYFPFAGTYSIVFRQILLQNDS